MIGDLAAWLIFVIVLVLLGLRAWLVETSPAGGVGHRDVRLVTIGIGVALGVLVVAVAVSGGIDLVGLLLNPPAPVPDPVLDPVPVPAPVPAPAPVPG